MRLNVLRRFGSDRSGVSALEFALVAPVFLTLLIGVIQMGWSLHCASNVRFAVKTAARQFMVQPNLSDQAFVTAMRAHLRGPSAAAVTVTVERQAMAGGPVFVRARSTYNHAFWAPMITPFTIVSRGETTVFAPSNPAI
jgi:Flp pilus assembly protein TadG